EVPPPGAKIVSGMWIFRVKRPPGSPPAFKARYVARGFSQRQGVDFFQTFSPTPKMTTLRVLLHVPAQRDYELHSLDFSTAFLQGSLHEEIWLRHPPGFTGSFPPGTQTTLAALGFVPSTADPSLFLRTDATLPQFHVLVYVDDLVFATADTGALAHVKSELQKRHTCTDLGELTSYLGLRITRDRAQRTITLTQSHMVQQVLQRFGFTYSSPQSTPLPTGHSLSTPPSDESVEPSGPYPKLVGCFMYLMTCTRPDLAYPLSLLARYVAPGRHRKVHWDAAKRVLRYLLLRRVFETYARDHFLALDPTALTVDLLEQHLLAAETSVVALGAAHGTLCTPFFERTLGILLLVQSAAAARARGGGRGIWGGGGGSSGSGGGSGGFGGGGGGSGGSGGSGSGGSGGGRTGAHRGGSGGGQRQRQQRRSETPSPQQLREWFAQRGASWGWLTPPGAQSSPVPQEPGGAEFEGAGSGGAKPGGEDSEGAGSGGAVPAGVEPWGTTSEGAKLRGTDSSGVLAGAPPRLSPRPEPLSPQQLR
ncbi:unnamed protein product, partial [Closterium sp. NIES-54]